MDYQLFKWRIQNKIHTYCFGQKSAYSKSDFQNQFSMSKNIGIFLTFSFKVLKIQSLKDVKIWQDVVNIWILAWVGWDVKAKHCWVLSTHFLFSVQYRADTNQNMFFFSVISVAWWMNEKIQISLHFTLLDISWTLAY